MVTSKSKLTLSKDAAANKRFAIVVSRYHEELTQALQKGALEALLALGPHEDKIVTYWVPGAFEIPSAARAVSQHSEVDAIICLGVILKGQTSHNEYIAKEVARGVSGVSKVVRVFEYITEDELKGMQPAPRQ